MEAAQQQGLLAGKKILVIEDEYFLAHEVQRALVRVGASVVGPFADVAQGLRAVEDTPDLSCAALDINVRDAPVFPVAEALRARQIPFVFTTGYDQQAIPAPYEATPRCEKPLDMMALVRLLAEV